MNEGHDSNEELRSALEQLLASGMAQEPIEHATQVANIAAILHSAFSAAGFELTLVGGSAIEVHAPGIYRSGDLDIVIERTRGQQERRDDIFRSLGFNRVGRHWRHGDQLFVELVSGPVTGPVEEVRVGAAEFRVVKKEVVLRDRLVGFKHWNHTAYGEQAIDMLAAFGDDLDMSWLRPELEGEDALDALEALRALATSEEPVTHQVLKGLIDELRRRT